MTRLLPIVPSCGYRCHIPEGGSSRAIIIIIKGIKKERHHQNDISTKHEQKTYN